MRSNIPRGIHKNLPILCLRWYECVIDNDFILRTWFGACSAKTHPRLDRAQRSSYSWKPSYIAKKRTLSHLHTVRRVFSRILAWRRLYLKRSHCLNHIHSTHTHTCTPKRCHFFAHPHPKINSTPLPPRYQGLHHICRPSSPSNLIGRGVVAFISAISQSAYGGSFDAIKGYIP